MDSGSVARSQGTPTDDLDRFRDHIYEHSGIHVEDSKSESLRVSLIARATHHGLRTLGEYLDLLRRDEQELRELLALVTINETSFFRFPEQFDALVRHVVPELLKGVPSGPRTLRFWSAGCSTGEEPYSIAMALLDSGALSNDVRAHVLGTDLSTVALDSARRGVYSQRALATVPADRIARHFTKVEEGWRVNDAVRSLCSFGYHNLAKEPPAASMFGSWDVIFCRNVTIYFRPESTRRVVHGFFESLRPGGYLFIGHSETLSAVSDEFEMVEVSGVFLYRRPAADAAKRSAGVDPVALRGRPDPSTTSGGPDAPGDVDSGDAQARDVPIEETALDDAIALADLGDTERARAVAARVLESDPLSAPAHHLMGVLSQRCGQLDRAVDELRRAVYADPDFAVAHVCLANIFRERGDRASARRSYENAIRSLRQSPDGPWTVFLGGFTPEQLRESCERGLSLCHPGVSEP